MFETHKLNEKGFEAVKDFKSHFSKACTEMLAKLPEGREKAIVRTKLEELVFFATKSIAAKSENNDEVIDY